MNSIVNKLLVELHIPGYQYCGPGTKLKERLSRGDPGINPLDVACKEHDFAYSKNRDNLNARHAADRVHTERAWKRVLAKDASLGGKTAAWGVVNTMKTKTKLGMGVRRKRKPSKKGLQKQKKVSLRHIIGAAKASMSPGVDAVRSALKGAREAVKNAGGRSRVRSPRMLPVPSKISGVLPFLMTLFAGLGATGDLAGGAAGIAKAVNAANAAKRGLEESKRHNETMEAIALGKGLYLKPYRKGLGLRVKNA